MLIRYDKLRPKGLRDFLGHSKWQSQAWEETQNPKPHGRVLAILSFVDVEFVSFFKKFVCLEFCDITNCSRELI